MSSLNPREARHFAEHANDWWTPKAGYDALHAITPLRLGYIRDQLCGHFRLDGDQPQPLNGLKILDVGCGGGLVAEPLSRLGAEVLGLDADPTSIAVAAEHAALGALSIHYQCGLVEELPAEPSFDAIVALEILEHVADPAAFIAELAKRLNKGGILVVSTLNRTPQAFLLGIVAAERLLRWVPTGTHHWSQFLRPSELAAHGRAVGLTLTNLRGIQFSPRHRLLGQPAWHLSDDLGINYLGVLVETPAV
jgi:2-polyprenyl-6-hydroxyphenyl methylase/3-demethylubiquinone-9 3-methyltransferase